MFRSINSAGLPYEVILEIFSYLDNVTLLYIATVNSQFNTASHDPVIWKARLKLFFPHKYQELESSHNVNWLQVFRHTWQTEYKDMTPEIRQLFNAVKRQDVKQLSHLPLPLENLDICDSKKISLLKWAQSSKNQRVLDYIYEIALLYHTNAAELTIDTNKKDKKRRTILYWALVCDQPTEQINLLILQGSNMNETYKGEGAPALIAAERGQLQTLMYLIEAEPALLEQQDGVEQTPLIWAASEGQTEIIRYLLSKGANVNAATKDEKEPQRTALFYAVLNQYTDIVKLLLAADASLELYNDGKHLIHHAAINGSLDIFKMLLEKNRELLEKTDACGQTPLLWACAKGNIDIVRFCLGLGANVHVKSVNPSADFHGKTPLFWAAEAGYADIVSLLINAGAEADTIIDYLKYSPIHAAAKNGHIQTIDVLLTFNLKLVEKANVRGETPLVLAAANGHTEVVEYLLNRNANTEVMTCWRPDYNDYGKTSLYLAVQNRHQKIVDALLRANARTDTATGKEKYKVVHLAAKNGLLSILIALLQHCPGLIEEKDSSGDTPLILAALNGHTNIVQYLIGMGANLKAATNSPGTTGHKRTALHWAIGRGHSDIVILLLKAGAKLAPDISIPSTQLSEAADKLLALEMYRVNREYKDEYLRSLTMFGVTKNFGAPKQSKLNAVEALKQVYFFGKSDLPLVQYEYEINNGELGAIYQRLKN